MNPKSSDPNIRPYRNLGAENKNYNQTAIEEQHRP